MAHVSGDDRSQLLLLPDAVDDYVGPDNPVRFIDAFVDSLDLAAAGFQRVQPKDTGRPGYDPADLLKLHIHGYLNRVRSSRRLEAETHRNLEAVWLLRRLKSDFKTIADFRRDNHKAFRAVFREFVRLCRELDLYGRELIAVDGTGIKAVNSVDRNFTKAGLRKDLELVDRRLERYLQQLAEADVRDAGDGTNAVGDLADKIAAPCSRRATLEGHGKALEESGEAQLSLTDPDARALAPAKRVRVGYTVRTALDDKHKLNAEQQTHSKVTDLGLLAETATAARENLGVDAIEAVADRGYFKIEDIEGCEANGVAPFVPKPDRSPARRRGHFPKSAFRYDSGSDAYICPAGRRLDRFYRARWPSTGMAHGQSSTPTGRRASPASCGTSAPAQRSEGSSATKTKRRWIGWPNVSRPVPRSWRGAGNRSNIRSVRSSSAWARAPS